MENKYHLDTNTINEQFFICEYSKRVYELSSIRDDKLQECVNIIMEIFNQENLQVTRDFASLFLNELIYYAEKRDSREMPGFHYPMVKELYRKIYQIFITRKYFTPLLQISLRFRVPYGSLYYPYDMKSVYEYYCNKNSVPLQLMMRNDVIKFLSEQTNNQLFFRVPISMSKKEMINYLTDSVNLYHKLKVINDTNYEELNRIFKQANEKTYRETESSTKNTILGLYVYDILLVNNINIDDIINIYQEYLCNSQFCISKFKTKDFENCSIKSRCRDYVRKQYMRINEKINNYFSKYDLNKLSHFKLPYMKRCEAGFADEALSDFYEKVSSRGESNLPG